MISGPNVDYKNEKTGEGEKFMYNKRNKLTLLWIFLCCVVVACLIGTIALTYFDPLKMEILMVDTLRDTDGYSRFRRARRPETPRDNPPLCASLYTFVDMPDGYYVKYGSGRWEEVIFARHYTVNVYRTDKWANVWIQTPSSKSYWEFKSKSPFYVVENWIRSPETFALSGPVKEFSIGDSPITVDTTDHYAWVNVWIECPNLKQSVQ